MRSALTEYAFLMAAWRSLKFIVFIFMGPFLSAISGSLMSDCVSVSFLTFILLLAVSYTILSIVFNVHKKNLQNNFFSLSRLVYRKKYPELPWAGRIELEDWGRMLQWCSDSVWPCRYTTDEIRRFNHKFNG